MTSGQGVEEWGDELVSEQRLANALLRPLTSVEKLAAKDWLEDAREEVRGRVPTLDARRAAGLTTDGQLRKVLAAAVVRVLRNPNAIRQYGVDDGTVTRDSALSAGLLYFTDDELALLSGVRRSNGEAPNISFSVPYR